MIVVWNPQIVQLVGKVLKVVGPQHSPGLANSCAVAMISGPTARIVVAQALGTLLDFMCMAHRDQLDAGPAQRVSSGVYKDVRFVSRERAPEGESPGGLVEAQQ